MEKRLITSALPYVNNVPHLGNLIQVLSADVFARYCRLRGFETVYICGTDEYGTATETKAQEEGISPRELCDRYHKIHNDIYEWLNISFDKFGRTSTEEQTKITQGLFNKIDEAGLVHEETIQQLFCEKCNRYLADRYVHGTCPHCAYEEARGDQCENCGKLLDPMDLKNPRCSSCKETPVPRETKHLYIDLPQIRPKLEEWINKRSIEGFWANNAIKMTKAWIRDGLKTRCITRDLKWGIPVPKEGFEDKVFYVWFDAPIGYISITAGLMDEWETWWKNPEEVKLYQFIGKDNIPFHTVIFPSTLLGSGENWTLLYHMSSSEYLNYENTKFSKSKGVGIFGDDIKETGIPNDVWRFYIYYNRPEKSDTQFLWKDFQEKVNGELIGNFANLVNRTLTFIHKNYNGEILKGEGDSGFWSTIKEYEKKIEDLMEKVEIRDAFRTIFELSSFGNKYFQDNTPWNLIKEDREKGHRLLSDLVYLVRDLTVLMEPFLPSTSKILEGFLGMEEISWKILGQGKGLSRTSQPKLLFAKLEDEVIEDFRDRFSGKQSDRNSPATAFNKKASLKVGRITSIQRHPEAEKLYVETVSFGDEERTIVSGLVPYYKEEELLNRNVIVVMNLKPAKLRGVLSQGMLLAADDKEQVEVLFVDDKNPGDAVLPEGLEARTEYAIIKKIDEFFEIPITVNEGTVIVGNKPLVCGERVITTTRVRNGEVG